jgi:predicted AlkP superfamily phosphohydrolase/phosphomutase
MRRVLLIALDAADKDTLLGWAENDTLPAFARLLQTAARGITESPPGLFVGAVWPSFWTSTSPAVHARYCYEQLHPGTYEDVRIHPTDTKAPPFWKAIGEAGRRVVVVDVPKTHPTEGLNGVHVVDWGTHDADYPHTAAWPPELARELDARHGADSIGNCNAFNASAERLSELRSRLLERIARKTDLVLGLMDRERFDCMIASFSDAHCICHQCWHLHDSSSAEYDPAAAAAIGDPVRDVFVALDGAVGRLLERADAEDDLDVIVMASHGFRPHYGATALLDEMLVRIERPGAAAPRSRATRFATRAWMTIPKPLRDRLRPVRTAARVRLGLPPRGTRRFFAVPNNDSCGGVRINLVGREPEGRVHPDQFEATCAEIERGLRAFTNAESGETVVREVVRSDSLYSGPNLHHLPDLIVFWNQENLITAVSSPRAGTIRGRHTRGRTGDHSPLGLFFYQGEGVEPGRLGRATSVMDYGPTIAERLGVPLEDVDGRSFLADVLGRGQPV